MINTVTRKNRHRRGAARTAVLALCAAGALALTGCASDKDTAASDPSATKPPASAEPAKHSDGGTADKVAKGPSAAPKGSKTGGPGSTGGSTAKAPSASPATKGPASGGTSGSKGTCDHKTPISPDEIAVYRYTPEGGSLSLIVKHGNWGCPQPDADGAPFETVGKETYLPMDQAAYVTATNPIVESSGNKRIGVQEFLDWLEANPNSGLVFKYHLGANGAIDSLEQVFTP
ncbi:hypothetical protein ACZ90_22770 [Streptomyces albus subsp. albus]|nr:hypothetical protein ACZ90_22770 [Streptomyces albus subsp. albus]